MRSTLRELRFVWRGWKANPVAQYTSLRRRPVALLFLLFMALTTLLGPYLGYMMMALEWNDANVFVIVFLASLSVLLPILPLLAAVGLVSRKIRLQHRLDLLQTPLRRSEVLVPVYLWSIVYLLLLPFTAASVMLGVLIHELGTSLSFRMAQGPDGFVSLGPGPGDFFRLIFYYPGELVELFFRRGFNYPLHLVIPFTMASFLTIWGLSTIDTMIKHPKSLVRRLFQGFFIALFTFWILALLISNLDSLSQRFQAYLYPMGVWVVIGLLLLQLRYQAGAHFFADVDPGRLAELNASARGRIVQRLPRARRPTVAAIRPILAPYRTMMALGALLLFGCGWLLLRPDRSVGIPAAAISLSFFLALGHGLFLWWLRNKQKRPSLPILSGLLFKSLHVYTTPYVIPAFLAGLLFVGLTDDALLMVSDPRLETIVPTSMLLLGFLAVFVTCILGVVFVTTVFFIAPQRNPYLLAIAALLVVVTAGFLVASLGVPAAAVDFTLRPWQVLWISGMLVFGIAARYRIDSLQQQELANTPIGQSNWDPQPEHPNDLGADGW